MPYEVTYTTVTRPTDLPEGATVKEVSALPLRFEADTESFAVTVSVNRTTLEEYTSQISLHDLADGEYVHTYLTSDQTRRVRDALTEALGETAPEETESARFWANYPPTAR